MRKTCPTCKGKGKHTLAVPMPMQVRCTFCKGTGEIDDEAPSPARKSLLLRLFEKSRKPKRDDER